MNRAFIIHGWDDSPAGSWFPWLKKELEKRSVDVHVPIMPDPHHPQIETWVATLAEAVGQPDEQTYLIGHSVGCQTIIRYLSGLANGEKIGGAVLVTG